MALDMKTDMLDLGPTQIPRGTEVTATNVAGERVRGRLDGVEYRDGKPWNASIWTDHGMRFVRVATVRVKKGRR